MDLSEILKLSVEERLELMARIWNTIPSGSENSNLESWQMRLVDQRVDSYRRKGESVSAREAAEEIRKRLKK